MKIIHKNQNYNLLSNLNIGDTFIIPKDEEELVIYLKVRDSEDDCYKVLVLDSPDERAFTIYNFREDVEVQLVNTELLIED